MKSFNYAVVLLASAAVASAAKFNVVTVTEQETVTVTKYVTAGGWRNHKQDHTTLVTSTVSAPPPPPEEPEPTVQPEVHHPPPEEKPKESTPPAPAPPPPAPSQPSNMAPPTSQSKAPSENDPAFVSHVLQIVNAHRQKHGANPLSWDGSLATYARSASDKCKMEHTRVGENIYSFGGSGAPEFISQTKNAIDAWMSEAPDYNGDGSAGHFTQMVWKASQRIGCGWNLQSCPGNNYYFFCEYDPYGNVMGQYSSNVS